MSVITPEVLGSPPGPPDSGGPKPIRVSVRRSGADQAYRGITRFAGLTTFIILFLIGLFLLLRAWPAFQKMGWAFFTTTGFITNGAHIKFGVASALYGTVVIAIIALVVAVPISIGSALFVSEYAPRQALGFVPVKTFLVSLVDLMAAVPSVIYGLWGFFVLQPHTTGFARWLNDHLGFIPLFRTNPPVTPSSFTSSIFLAGLLVGIMIMPIVTSLSREVFSLAPPGEREGALALGASRARVIRDVVFPFGKGGVIGAVMLGLGRALGETIAVTIIISQTFTISDHITSAGGNSIAALIALRFGAGGPLGLSALLAAGFVLFVFTLVVNLVASWIVNRSTVFRS